MKKIFPGILLLIAMSISAYEVGQFNQTFVDSSRDNRQIETEIFYPVSSEFSREEFPIIIFGHGWLMNYSNYSQFGSELVSAGNIVAFPRTEENLWPDHQEFALDLSFLSTALQQENMNVASALFGIVDSLSFAMGHSMGGGCAVLSAAESDVFSAMITFAAADTDPSAIIAADNIIIPTITFSASADNIAPPSSHQIPIYENLQSDYKAYISLLGEDHLGITSNNIAFDLIHPFLNFISSGNTSYQTEFEMLLQNYALDNEIEYELIDNVSASEELQLNLENSIWNYPNPFDPSTTISFSLTTESIENTEIVIYNLKGQKVKTLECIDCVDASSSQMNRSITWNGRDENHRTVNSGVYVYQLKADGKTIASRKMLLLK